MDIGSFWQIKASAVIRLIHAPKLGFEGSLQLQELS